jgi:tetratricopeptide (TPR) repeat protein
MIPDEASAGSQTSLQAQAQQMEIVQAGPQPAAMPLAADASYDPVSPTALARLAAAAGQLQEGARSQKLNRAINLLREERLPEAEALALEVLQQDDSGVLGWRIMATAREKSGDYSTALFCLEQVFKRDPQTPGIENELGRVAFHLAMFPQAEALFRLHLERAPDDADALNNLACALRDQMRYDEAIDLLKAAIQEHLESPMLWNTLATLMVARGDTQNAMIFFDEAVRLDENYAKAIYNRANLKLLIGDGEGAIADGRRALSLATSVTDKAMMELALALSLLGDGQVDEGWRAYEARRDPHFNDVTLYPFDQPLWEPGMPLAGKSLLMLGEQGLGDEVMFSNVVPDLIEALGPEGRLYLAVEPRLVGLYQRSFPKVVVGPHATGKIGHQSVRIAPFAAPHLDQIDYWAPMAAPLRQFRNSPDAYPQRDRFLVVDPQRLAHWRAELAALGPQPKLGVLWKSLVTDPARSRFFSPFDNWAPVLTQPGLTLVNLQYGDCSAELAEAEARGIRLWTPPGIDLKNDLDDLAALCLALDLVVGPSNATTNLAAASGGQVSLVSLPGAWPQLGTPGWPWYPQLKVFVAERCGAWDSAIAALAQSIAQRFGASETD